MIHFTVFFTGLPEPRNVQGVGEKPRVVCCMKRNVRVLIPATGLCVQLLSVFSIDAQAELPYGSQAPYGRKVYWRDADFEPFGPYANVFTNRSLSTKNEISCLFARMRLRNLIDAVSKGEEYLRYLDGTPGSSEQLERVRVIDHWLAENAEAVFGVQPTVFGSEFGAYTVNERDDKGLPVFKADWKWRCTTGRDRIYLHLFSWPQGGFTLNDVPNRIAGAYFLSDPKQRELVLHQTGNSVRIELPEEAPDKMITVVVLQTEGDLIRPAVEKLSQGFDGVLTLSGSEAMRVNAGHQPPALSIEGSTLVCWKRPDDYAVWAVKIKNPGRFRVFLSYSRGVTPKNAPFQFAAGDETLCGSMASTGGWGMYKTVEVGAMAIPEAGDVTLSFKPMSLNRIFCNLRSVMLVHE